MRVTSPAFDLFEADEPATSAGKAEAFARTFALILLTEYWARAIPLWSQLASNYFVTLAIGTVLCLGALLPHARRAAFAGLAINHLILIWYEFPAAGNHAYLELYLCAFLAFLDSRKPDERTLLLGAVRWILCVIFFYSGLHKLIYGYYFQGQYLAYSMWIDTFRPVLAWLLPVAEYQRLATFTGQPGDGSYLVDSRFFLLLSNGVWLAELLLAPLLAWSVTRPVAVLGGVLLMVAIELAAREFFFGLIVVASLLLFVRSDLNRRLEWSFALALGSLLLSRLGVLPTMKFY